MVTRGKALENWQLCTYFTDNVLDDLSNTSGVKSS